MIKKAEKVVKTSKGIGIEVITKGGLVVPKNNQPDLTTQAQLNDLEGERLLSLQQDREMRKNYADKIYLLVRCWLATVAVILLISGFGKSFDFFELEAIVLSTLVGGTTLGVVGLFATVAKYLFNEKQIK